MFWSKIVKYLYIHLAFLQFLLTLLCVQVLHIFVKFMSKCFMVLSVAINCTFKLLLSIFFFFLLLRITGGIYFCNTDLVFCTCQNHWLVFIFAAFLGFSVYTTLLSACMVVLLPFYMWTLFSLPSCSDQGVQYNIGSSDRKYILVFAPNLEGRHFGFHH